MALQIKKPGFLDNTFANRLKRPHAKAWAAQAGTQTLARKTRAKILAGCSGSQSLCSDTLEGISFLAKVLLEKPGFWAVGVVAAYPPVLRTWDDFL